MTTSWLARALSGLFVGGLILLPAAPAEAQDGFLFSQPDLTLSLFGGWALPGEDSDVFSQIRDDLEIERGDFSSPVGMVELAWRVNERVDLALGVEHASRTVSSESRRFTWEDDRPILQTTEFSRTRVLASGKLYLFPRGREVSQFAWVPTRWTPYVGGGGGLSFYEFVQDGDFAVQVADDPPDWRILGMTLDSDGNDLTGHALAGVQLSLTTRFLLRGEYRYHWGSAALEPASFQGFEPIDLSGSNVMLGVTVRM